MSKSICLREISHSFGDKQVLKGISLEVGQGEIFGLLGPSGAGKTTLINILTGQLRASAGAAALLDVPVEQMTGEDYRQLGIMMDHFGLYERMSCYDNLRFYQMLDGNGKDGIEEVLRGVGLSEAQKTPVMNLSKGMTNRLAFARAILRSPKILFLDEPTSGLDPTTVEAIHKMILEEKQKGTTIFLTTHNMHEAEKLCDNIALLNEGRIVEYGAPADICRRYYHQKRIQLHLKSGEDIVLSYDADSGKKIKEYLEMGELETIHSTEPDLETIFMELTGRGLEKE